MTTALPMPAGDLRRTRMLAALSGWHAYSSHVRVTGRS